MHRMEFNTEKCKVLHLVINNRRKKHEMRKIWLGISTHERALGDPFMCTCFFVVFKNIQLLFDLVRSPLQCSIQFWASQF